MWDSSYPIPTALISPAMVKSSPHITIHTAINILKFCKNLIAKKSIAHQELLSKKNVDKKLDPICWGVILD